MLLRFTLRGGLTEEGRKQDHGADAALLDLWRFARRRASRWCVQTSGADDVAQEVLIEYWRQRERINDPRAWVMVVAPRVALRMGTKARPSSAASHTHAPTVAPARDLSIDLLRAFRRLDVRSQKLLVWTARGETHEQIAMRLGCGRGDIGTLLGRVRSRLASLTGQPFPAVVSKRRIRDTPY